MSYEHDSVIGEYSHDKFRPREAEALFTLRKIASLVKPIMRTRGWRVGVLAEMYPTEKNLLGLNHDRGQKICLRLRHPGDERQFIPIEQVTDTMLHELSHNVFGPHDEHFHNLWNTLRDEHENLIRKGYTGEGFLSTGRKLGGKRIPRDEARRRARAEAEKRRTLIAGSGQRLGGAPVRRGQDIRKTIADAAARRIRIQQGCAAEQITTKQRQQEIIEGTNKNGTRTKAEAGHPDEEIMMTAYIDLVQEEEREKYGESYIPPSWDNPAGSQGGGPTPRQHHHPPHIPTSTKPPPPPPSSSISSSRPPKPPAYNTDWTCDICTCINPSTYLYCDACTTERPSPPPSPIPRDTLPTTGSHTASLRDSNSQKAIRSLMNLDKTGGKRREGAGGSGAGAAGAGNARPMGWSCHQCGNWMEELWWTCAGCGCMKLSS